MRIHEVCKECSLTKKAIEYYAEQGLIQPVTQENGYRHFSEDDVEKLKKIAVLRSLELSVSDIRTLLEHSDMSLLRAIHSKRALAISDWQEKQLLLTQLAEEQNWDAVQERIEALQKKRSILTRMLDKFPGFYGKFVCAHFSPFLGEPITTEEQQEAFHTIIRFLDNVTFPIPEELQEYLSEMDPYANATVAQSTSAALRAAIENPEKYIHDNKDILARYQMAMASAEYKATPAYKLKELFKQLQSENGYNDIFIPAMQRLSPAYREYFETLQAANAVFLQHYPAKQ